MYFMPASLAMRTHSSASNFIGLNSPAIFAYSAQRDLQVPHHVLGLAVLALPEAAVLRVEAPVDEHPEARVLHQASRWATAAGGSRLRSACPSWASPGSAGAGARLGGGVAGHHQGERSTGERASRRALARGYETRAEGLDVVVTNGHVFLAC